jgi:hypothetical protein
MRHLRDIPLVAPLSILHCLLSPQPHQDPSEENKRYSITNTLCFKITSTIEREIKLSFNIDVLLVLKKKNKRSAISYSLKKKEIQKEIKTYLPHLKSSIKWWFDRWVIAPCCVIDI